MRFTNLAKTVRKVSGQAGEVVRGRGVQIRNRIREGESGIRFRAGRRNFYVTGVDMGNPDAEQFGIGKALMTGKEKGMDREISKKQVRKQM